jgi:hypothetical protein
MVVKKSYIVNVFFFVDICLDLRLDKQFAKGLAITVLPQQHWLQVLVT